MRNDEISFVESGMQCRRTVIAAGCGECRRTSRGGGGDSGGLLNRLKGRFEHDLCCQLRLYWLKSGYHSNHEAGWMAGHETYLSAELGRCEHEGKIMTRLAVVGVPCGG